MEKIVIEKANIEDAEELLSIYEPYVANTAISFEYEVPSLKEFRGRIEAISSRFPYIKAVQGGEIVGYAYAGNFKGRRAYDWAVETTVYVKKDLCRGGVGRALYQSLEKSLKEMGILNMNACIAKPIKEGPYLTDDSIRFHKAMGFTEVGVFHKSGYKFNRWFDMIWMEKHIGEHTENQKPVSFGNWHL